MSLRVVSIISRMNVGGPALLIAELMDGISTDELQHTLITGTCAPNEIDYLTLHPSNSEVVYLKDFGKTPSMLLDIKSFFRLVSLLKKLRPDIVHTHTSKAGVLGRIAAKVANPRTKIIHTFHGHLLYGYFSPWKVRIVVVLERLLAKISTLLVGVTNQVKNDLLEVGIGTPSQWKVIYPGITRPVPIGKGPARKLISANAESFLVVWIGRFTEIKDPYFALSTISQINPVFKDRLQFFFIGDGELLAESQQMALNNVFDIRFAGWQGDVSRYLESSDLLLMTSLNEGMPVALLEAASFGVPAIAPDVGGISEFVGSENGLLINRTPKDFALAIENLISEPDQLQILGEEARQKYLEQFSISIFINAHIEMYRGCVND